MGSRAHEIQTTSRNCTNIVLFAEKPASVKQKSPISRQTGHLNTSICIDEGKSCVFKIRTHFHSGVENTEKSACRLTRRASNEVLTGRSGSLLAAL